MSQILDLLKQIRETYGEEEYQRIRLETARDVASSPGADEVFKNLFPDLDLEAIRSDLRESAVYPVEGTPQPKADPDRMMLQVMQAQMPNLKTQAQYNTFMAAFDALRVAFNAYFGGDFQTAGQARKALNDTLDAAAQIYDMHQKVSEIPSEQRSDASQEFLAEPLQFTEYDTQKSLMGELSQITSLETLKKWYQDSRKRMDSIVSQNLRNTLFDAIRTRRLELEK